MHEMKLRQFLSPNRIQDIQDQVYWRVLGAQPPTADRFEN